MFTDPVPELAGNEAGSRRLAMAITEILRVAGGCGALCRGARRSGRPGRGIGTAGTISPGARNREQK